MSQVRVQVNRALVGAIALSCLAAGAALLWWDSWENVWCGAFIRVGLVMSAIWLAMPTSKRDAAWANVSPYTLVGLLIGALLVARYPRRALPFMAVVLVLAYFLRPRSTRRRGTNTSHDV